MPVPEPWGDHEAAGVFRYSRCCGGSLADTGTCAPDSDAMKNRRRTTTKTKRPSAPQVLRPRVSSPAGRETKVAHLTRELNEAKQQQTATLEVLKIISSSPNDLASVFDAMLERATRLCEATHGHVWRFDGEQLHAVAVRGDPQFEKWLRQHNPVRPIAGSAAERIVRGARFVHVADRHEEDAYRDNQTFRELVDTSGIRASLSVALRRDETLLGMINVYRQELRPFTEEQIQLLQNFAAQAVIAIENTRLLNELRQRTDDLTESLEQQTATSEVLSVISSSPGELEPVFRAMLANAVRICEAKFGTLYLRAGDVFRAAALHNAPPAFVEFWQRGPHRAGPRTVLSRVLRTKEVVHISDITADQAYTERDPLFIAAAELGGFRTVLAVPMLKETDVLGAIYIYRQEVRPFSNKQIALLASFASQAVIAIENTRLLNELRESLQQQTATADVLKVISSSPGELEPVFQAMLQNAVNICEATFGNLLLYEGDLFRHVALHNAPQAWAAERQRDPVPPRHAARILYRVAETKQVAHIADMAAESPEEPISTIAGARTVVIVPMLKEHALIGAIAIFRQEVKPFTDKQIDLVQNFASQAVIAIENARLLNELRQRTDDLSKSLDDLRTAQDRLVQTQKLASLGQLTAGIAHEIKNPLNFVNNFSGVSVELIDELQETLGRVTADDKTRGEITELAETLRDNLDKIVQHGKRADSIVKNMLLHSREGSGERRPVDVNALVEESLNLAYHGARAETRGFNVTLERSLDPKAGEVDVFPQEITRVLLNLISNGFYAATKRQGQESGNGFEPTITAATKSLGDRVEIRIRDNGIGIPPEVREKMFNPFFTTKPAGEGTGLGLSISHDIIVKQHSGSIEVDTEPGLFTEFRIILPRSA
jgi:signal transduction histidine kinase